MSESANKNERFNLLNILNSNGEMEIIVLKFGEESRRRILHWTDLFSKVLFLLHIIPNKSYLKKDGDLLVNRWNSKNIDSEKITEKDNEKLS